MSKVTVNYSVEYQCELEVSPEEDLEDRISDIDIPEGGHNNSRYVSDSFIWLTHSEKRLKNNELLH